MTYAFLILGIALVLIFVSKRTAKVTLNVAFLKAVASACFITTGVMAMAENPDCPKLMGALVAVAGVWGTFGDIALDLKYVFKKYEEQYLNAGFSSFGVGHIFYSAALISCFGFNKKALILAVVTAIACLGFVFVSEPLLKVKYGKFKAITAAYMVFLGFIVGLSVGYAIFSYSTATLMLAIGFVLFILSDVFLSGLYFGPTEKERTSRPAIIINHLLYYGAQFTIATSLLFIKG